jgi:hypothetical protein
VGAGSPIEVGAGVPEAGWSAVLALSTAVFGPLWGGAGAGFAICGCDISSRKLGLSPLIQRFQKSFPAALVSDICAALDSDRSYLRSARASSGAVGGSAAADADGIGTGAEG